MQALGKKETLRRLAAVGRDVDRLDGIVISHEHSDHIGSLAQVLGQWRTTVYLNEATHTEVMRIPGNFAQAPGSSRTYSAPDRNLSWATLKFLRLPFRTTRSIRWDTPSAQMETKIAIVTDLGYLPELVKVHLREADCLVLESNHDLGNAQGGTVSMAHTCGQTRRHSHRTPSTHEGDSQIRQR